MATQNHFNLKNFLIGLAAATVAILLILYAAKVWFIDKKSSGLRSDVNVNTQTDASRQKKHLEVIPWQDVDKHYGEYATVEGTIVATHNSGKVCFLNFHRDYRRSFTAVIFASTFPLFPANPEKYYYDKKVRISGQIKEYNGRPEIILDNPSQIEVLK